MTPVVEVVNKIYNDFKTREWEGVVLKLKEGEYTKNNLPPKSKLEEIIRNSMRKAGLEGDEIDERNKLAVFSAFNTLLRKTNKSVIPTRIAQTPQVISTRKRDRETLSIGSLRSTSTVFYTSNYQDEIKDVQVIAALEEAIEEMPRRACLEQNPFLFKTPVDIVFTTAEPERLFVQRLCKEANASKISAWLKSRSQNFYSIEYSISSSNRTKQRSFNPDFLIKIEEDDHEFIIVVEIKSDKDYSDENKAKFTWATIHFEDLNRELKTAAIQQTYIFHFLSPENYDIFFQYLRDGKLTKGMFVSHLDNELSAAE
ncbi:MAG: TnsA endonuclease N-terminal domain-containing protein, partial [Bacteroidota bacterium]